MIIILQRFGFNLASIWLQLCIDLASTLHRFGFNFASIWLQLGSLRTLSNQIRTFVGSFHVVFQTPNFYFYFSIIFHSPYFHSTIHHVSQPPRVTTTTCHHHHVSPPPRVTTTTCYHHHVLKPPQVTTTTCHHVLPPPSQRCTRGSKKLKLSRSYNIDIGVVDNLTY